MTTRTLVEGSVDEYDFINLILNKDPLGVILSFTEQFTVTVTSIN